MFEATPVNIAIIVYIDLELAKLLYLHNVSLNATLIHPTLDQPEYNAIEMLLNNNDKLGHPCCTSSTSCTRSTQPLRTGAVKRQRLRSHAYGRTNSVLASTRIRNQRAQAAPLLSV